MVDLVSVVIPVHNGVATLDRAIESVLSQTHSRLELFVVDDGSTDGTLQAARAVSDDRVRVLSRPNPSGGPGAPRNMALDLVAGSWVAFLDADDVWFPDKLRLQLAAATADSAVLYSRCVWRSSEGDSDYHERAGYTTLPAGACAPQLLRHNFVPVLTAVLRTKWMQQVGHFNWKGIPGAEDYDYWLRVAMSGGQFTPLEEQTATYHVHSTNMSHALDWHEMKAAIFGRLAGQFPEYRNDLLDRKRISQHQSGRRRLAIAKRHLIQARTAGRPSERLHDVAAAMTIAPGGATRLLRSRLR